MTVFEKADKDLLYAVRFIFHRSYDKLTSRKFYGHAQESQKKIIELQSNFCNKEDKTFFLI